MFKNIIFDFGQVLVRFDPDFMTAAYVSDEKERQLISKIVFDRKYWDRLDEGNICDDEVIKGICSSLPTHLHEKAILVYTNWIYNIPNIDGMLEILQTLKNKGVKLYLLSNISTTFAQNYTKSKNVAELLSYFDGLTFSGPIKLTKPNREIFEYLLSTHSLSASDCLFIDDNEKNIEGCKSVGITGYLFDGNAKKLREYLSI